MEPARKEVVLVYERGNLRGTATPENSRPGYLRVHLDQGGDLLVPADVLIARNDDRYELRVTSSQLAAFHKAGEAKEEPVVIPVVEEKLHISKRKVETGKVFVKKTVQQHEEVVELPLTTEEIEIERIPVNRYIEAAPNIREEGDVTVIPVVEEVLVVEKRLLLKEEVHIVRRRKEEPYKQAFVLRREEIEIERNPAEPGTPALGT